MGHCPHSMFSIIHLFLFLTIWNTAQAVNVTVLEEKFDANSSNNSTNSTCPSGWFNMSSVGMGCLLFYHSETYTWSEASKYCHSQGAFLVEILSSSQLEFVTAFLDGLDNMIGARNWWTAGSDFGVEGEWRWMVSLQPVESFVWSSGQPNDGEDASCLALRYWDYMGYDDDCNSEFNPICQQQ